MGGLTSNFLFNCFLAGQPEEWLLEVVVALGGYVVVLEVLLAVEHDALGFHFPARIYWVI